MTKINSSEEIGQDALDAFLKATLDKEDNPLIRSVIDELEEQGVFRE